jgi:putative thioredoxin
VSDAAAKGAAAAVTDLSAQAATYAALLRGRYKSHLKHGDVTRALAAVDLLAAAGESAAQLAPLLQAVAAAPADPHAHYALAEAQLATGQHAAAVDSLLAVLKLGGPGWRDGLARATLLKLFETLGASSPVASAGRRALSKLLFR